MIFLLIMVFGIFVLDRLLRTSEFEESEVEVDQVDTCPPHQWRYEEVTNDAGETVRWKLICAACGPLSNT